MGGREEEWAKVSDEKGIYMLNIDTFRDQACDKEMNLVLAIRNVRMICTWRSSIKNRSRRSLLGGPRRSRTRPPIPTLTLIFRTPNSITLTTPKNTYLFDFWRLFLTVESDWVLLLFLAVCGVAIP